MLKVEGIAFRFLPDPVQIKNALEVSIGTAFMLPKWNMLKNVKKIKCEKGTIGLRMNLTVLLQHACIS